MLSISKGVLNCWPQFSLKLESPIVLASGNTYHLVGDNGSGKSSFITQILLPLMKVNEQLIYRIYVQQLFHLQGYAIRAHAAINKPNIRLRTEADCLAYLLDNLADALSSQPRPVYVIADESQQLSVISLYLKQLSVPCCLLYCQHGGIPLPETTHTIMFQPLSSQQSKTIL